MHAYHNNSSIKQEYLNRVVAHRVADKIVKGQYWRGGKGCAVGCTIHGNDHSAYERELGIPQMLARLEDRIFEGLSHALAMTWPERFLAAIQPGADLSRVGWQFQHWLLLEEVLPNVKGDGAVFDQVRTAIVQCADVLVLLTKGQPADGSAAYVRMSEKLLELLAASPVSTAVN